MVSSTPTGRLEALVQEFGADRETVGELLDAYETFLTNTDAPEHELVQRFMDPGASRQYFAAANDFGDLVWQLLDRTGKGTRLHRLLLV
jgi:hypothetical protein